MHFYPFSKNEDKTILPKLLLFVILYFSLIIDGNSVGIVENLKCTGKFKNIDLQF